MKTIRNIWQRSLVALLLFHLALPIFSQVPYGYAPANAATDDLSALGGNINQFVQGLTKFDPAQDPVLQRLKGKEVKGVRCYVRADYKQSRQKRSGVLASSGKPDNIVRQTYADLSEGWNDVLFDEPFVIGDEAFYLGWQAYETIGTPYPLVAYAKATVPQSCFVNLGKKSWEEYTDRGTLLIFALLDDEAASSFDHAAYAQNTTHPQTVAPDQDFTGGLYIHNFSPNPIENLKIAMRGEGATAPTYKTISLPAPLEAYGSTVVVAQLRAGTTEGTSVDWTCTVSKLNQKAAQSGRPGVTKLYVTVDNFQRTPIIEEFTSQRCVNCPQMAYFLEKALEQYGGPYVYVAHHSGFQNDSFTCEADKAITYIFGGYENEYNPAIMYNRAVLDGENTVIQGIRDMSPTPYLEALAKAAQMPAMAEVNIQSDGSNITVSGRIARDLASQSIYLSCYLVEDGISIEKYPQLGMDDDDAPDDLKDVFRHNGVILHHFTDNAVGDVLSVNSDGTFSVSFASVEKAGFGGNGQRLVALVHKVNKNDLRDNQVLNAAQMAYKTSGIHQFENENQASEAAVYDLNGRRIQNWRQNAEKSLPKGIYIANGKKIVVK